MTTAAYRATNKEKIAIAAHAYYVTHRNAFKTYKRAYRQAHPQLRKAEQKRYRARYPAAWRHKRYGLTEEAYNVLYEQQHGLCAACYTPLAQLQVDHDHQTLIIRGLVCGPCNRAMGQVGDDPGRLRALANFLDSTKTRQA